MHDTTTPHTADPPTVPVSDPSLPPGTESPEDQALDAVAPRYRATHARDGQMLGSPAYPDNRAGRRALARSWKRSR